LIKKKGPAGIGPATKCIQAQIQFNYTFTWGWKAIANLAI